LPAKIKIWLQISRNCPQKSKFGCKFPEIARKNQNLAANLQAEFAGGILEKFCAGRQICRPNLVLKNLGKPGAKKSYEVGRSLPLFGSGLEVVSF
jgi:hypothetical protein